MDNDKTLIAVVDDEPPVRTMLSRALRLADYDVAAYAGGADFVASLTTQTPGCAVVDVRMPGMSGFDVVRHVGSTARPFPVILITASSVEAIDDEAVAAGAFRLLRKPFSTDALLVAVHEAMAGRVSSARVA